MLGLKLHVYTIQLVCIAGQYLNPASATFLPLFAPPCIHVGEFGGRNVAVIIGSLLSETGLRHYFNAFLRRGDPRKLVISH